MSAHLIKWVLHDLVEVNLYRYPSRNALEPDPLASISFACAEVKGPVNQLVAQV